MKRCLAAWMAMVAMAWGQGTVPVFRHQVGADSYTMGGGDPGRGATTTISTMLVPVRLEFEHRQAAGKALALDAGAQVGRLLASPVFEAAAWGGGSKTQYIDGMMRAMFPQAKNWHTMLAKPEVKPVRVSVPVGYGYVLTSKSSGKSVAVADLDYVQGQLLKQLGKQEGKFVVAVTLNTAFYALGDATVCCSWGTHGVDRTTGQSFVLGSYLHDAPAVIEDRDVQPLTQQLAQFFKDPLSDPQAYVRSAKAPGNRFPAWTRPAVGSCAGPAAGSQYFHLEPTDTNAKNNFPASRGYEVKTAGGVYHVQNATLLGWYAGGKAGQFSWPDAGALKEKAVPCAGRGGGAAARRAEAAAIPHSGSKNGHMLIGYWAAYGGPSSILPLREVSPQWDVILVAFSTPDKNAPEGTMQFRTPAGLKMEEFKADIQWLKSRGKKVLISLGGGGQHFTLADEQRVPNFVESVARIVTEYGFDGIDIDFESPSLAIAPGDTDYRKPTTPSIVNLISALKQLRARLGEKFLITLVPEGTQIPSGYPSYGGQFGSFLPIMHALRDVLWFSDTQSYNTPPLLGLDGEIYQPGTVDYHVAMTELVLHGFNVGGDPNHYFPPLPASKVAVGFLNGDTTPEVVKQTMDYLITGRRPPGAKYKLRRAGGYPEMIGAMFWTINADRRAGYDYSNTVGPLLRSYPGR